MQELSRRVRRDGRFEQVGQWPWSQGRNIELWRRRSGAGGGHLETFDQDFIRLARGMETGPAGLAKVMSRIGIEHQLDGHFLYQERVKAWAEQQLQKDPNDADALWSLGLIDVLRNRPAEAQQWFGRLAASHPQAPWPATYQAVTLLADGHPIRAHRVLQALPPEARSEPVVQALADLTHVLGGRLDRIPATRASVEAAIARVRQDVEDKP
jgi:hypothetical protein